MRLRRSLAIAPQLPTDAVQALLAECEQLLAERDRIAALLSDASVPFRHVRQLLAELHRVLHSQDE